MSDYIYDIETFPNVFLLNVEHAEAPFTWRFEISDWRNDSSLIIQFVRMLADEKARMVGFNNIGFDYPVVHMLLRMGFSDAATLYQKAQSIIASQDGDGRWTHEVRPADRIVDQIDLYRIHHFDNRARATSLKVLEFNMRAQSIEDLPFPVGTHLSREQAIVLADYGAHDVAMTKRFYRETLPMIRFREELTVKYSRDFMNHNDTKIGKDFFLMRLEASGVPCYDYDRDGRSPRQTKRPTIVLKDAIFPWIEFRNPEFQRILDWLRDQVITETKGVFKDLIATVNGFDYVFGTGGIHGSVENQRINADHAYLVIDIDVSSYYPNLAIQNRLYPAHLGETFCDVYSDLYDQRKKYPKGSAENAMLKLALNGTYGDSNNVYSAFYDPLFTMSITLNGQLLLCWLAETLIEIPGLEMIQINTDGLTIRVPRENKSIVYGVCNWWEELTRLKLEMVNYTRMHIADVNNYLAVRDDGTTKRKGRFEYDLEWHQNHSALVVPKVAERVLVDGAPIRETLEQWSEILDFMLRVKVPRGSHLSVSIDGKEHRLQNTTRYLVVKGGGQLYKWMPPLNGANEWRRIAVNAGWGVQVCNRLGDELMPIDMDFYAREVEKLVLGVM